MAKQSKVEKYKCEHIVEAGLMDGKPLREIASECSKHAGEPISHGAISRYIALTKDENQREKKEVILQDRRRILKVVSQEIDIIQLQYQTTETLLNHFNMIDGQPEIFEKQIKELIDQLAQHDDVNEELIEYLAIWKKQVDGQLKNKVSSLTSLNRELRENSKFLAEIRAKAFSFSLVQEYLALFMQKFKEESADGAFERTLQWISANPRMQQIVDQQRFLIEQGSGG
jgi:hypothetical protein